MYVRTYLQREQNTVLAPVQKVLVQCFRELFYLNVQMSVEGGGNTSLDHNNHIDTHLNVQMSVEGGIQASNTTLTHMLRISDTFNEG